MTLTTHALVGAAAAALVPQNPLAGFCLGFVSHFAIDAIPHWHEGGMLRSARENPHDPLDTDMVLGKEFLGDLVFVGGDAVFGLALAVAIFGFWLFHLPLIAIVAGVVGGQLPDALQFVYYKLRPAFMTPLQRFHVHIQHEFDNPLMLLVEAALVVAVIAALKFLIYS